MVGRSSMRRVWLFRFLAIAFGLSPFVAAELVLRAAGAGLPIDSTDPYVEFSAIRPLFVLNEAQDRYVISASRQPYFKPDGFAARKSGDEFRIFCLGGSTVQGNPYSLETSFTTWLELSLQAADPSRRWEVVNCGGISYASYRLAPILQECLNYQPDLFVIYTGHNEFLEDRSYGPIKQLPKWLLSLYKLRLVHVARQYWVQMVHRGSEAGQSADRTLLADEVEALLDYRGGLEHYHRDDVWRRGVVEHFRFTLARMVHDAEIAGVPVLLADPVCNLKDCAPFKVEAGPGISSHDESRFEQLLESAHAQGVTTDQAVEQLREAVALDPRHAGAWFVLGQALLQAGQVSEARNAFVRAKDEDVCPLRIIEPLREVLVEISRQSGRPLIPVREHFQDKSPHRIPGDELLLDHVHPSITGHQMIAELILDAMTDLRLVQPIADWRSRQQPLYRAHLATLDTPYYARGKEHLEGLRKWAQGRVSKLRDGKASPPAPPR